MNAQVAAAAAEVAAPQPMLLGVTRDHIASALQTLSPANVPTDAACATWSKAADDWLKLFIEGGARPLFTPPPIGEYWIGQGGIYDGQVREEDGTIYHQIHAEVKPAGRLDHAAATKWAASLTIDGHSDFTLPTRRGLSLVFANLVDRFERTWYWSSAIYSASCAWICNFGNGYQNYNVTSARGAALAVRRFVA